MQRALAEAVQDQEQQAIEAELTKDTKRMKPRNMNDKEYLKQYEPEDFQPVKNMNTDAYLFPDGSISLRSFRGFFLLDGPVFPHHTVNIVNLLGLEVENPKLD